MAEAKWSNTRKFITTYGSQVENEIETRLHNRGKIASGKLYDSIGFKVGFSKGKFSLRFVMEYYGTFVDKGTKPSKYANAKGKGTGKSEFIKSLFKWCQIKGLPKSAAFAIRKKIWKEGLPPTYFFTLPTTRRQKQYEAGVEKNMALDIEKQIQNAVK